MNVKGAASPLISLSWTFAAASFMASGGRLCGSVFRSKVFIIICKCAIINNVELSRGKVECYPTLPHPLCPDYMIIVSSPGGVSERTNVPKIGIRYI